MVAGYGASAPPPATEAGFTLLEVMVSLAILSMGILMVIQLFSGGLDLARAASDHTGAVLLAREKMAQTLVEKDLKAGVTGGAGADGLQWKVEVSPYDNKIAAASEGLSIMKVVVSVKDAGKGEGAFTLSSIKSIWSEE